MTQVVIFTASVEFDGENQIMQLICVGTIALLSIVVVYEKASRIDADARHKVDKYLCCGGERASLTADTPKTTPGEDDALLDADKSIEVTVVESDA